MDFVEIWWNAVNYHSMEEYGRLWCNMANFGKEYGQLWCNIANYGGIRPTLVDYH